MDGNKSQIALKAGIWYVITNFISKGLVFITTPIFTRMLSKTEYGQYSNFATWQSLLIIIVTLQLSTTILRAKFDFPDDMDEYSSTIAILGVAFTGLSYVIVVIFMPFFSSLFDMKPQYVHIMFIYLLTAPALQILQTKSRVFMKYKASSLLTFASSVLSIFVAVFMVYISDDKLFGRVFGQEIVLIIFDSLLLCLIIVKGKSLKINYCKYALAIAIPLIPHLLAGNLLGSVDKIIIQKECGASDLAAYSVAFSCTLIATVLWDSLNQAMSPWLFENLKNKKYSIIKKTTEFYVMIFMGIAIGIMLISPEIIYLFGGREYANAKYIMPPLIMGCCFQFVYSLYVNIEFYLKKTFLISIGTIMATVIDIVLNIVFIPKFGYIAAAYTTMVAYGSMMIFHSITVKKLNLFFVYNNHLNYFTVLLMLIVSIVISVLYSIEFLRIMLLILYLSVIILLAIWKKKELYSLYLNIFKKESGR